MRPGELRVRYYLDDHSKELGNALIECARQFGYELRAHGSSLRSNTRDILLTLVPAQAACEHEHLYIRWDYCEGGLPTCKECGMEFTGSEFDSQFTIVRKSAQTEEGP